MTRIAFIGLGIMGLPMATNLIEAGHEVAGFNRSPEKTQKLADHGARAADSITDAVRDAEVVITMLPDSPDVEAVTDEVCTADRALWLDMSTIAPATARAVAETAREYGLRPLDAPVSGGEQGAKDGTLSIMVGGAKDDVAAAQPVLDVLGATVVHVGPSGAGQTVKAANQLIVAGTIGLVAEALTFLNAQQVDLKPAVDVLGGGLAGSAVLERKAEAMLNHEFTPGFRIDLHRKDLGIALDSARAAGVPLPVGAIVAQLMAAAQAQGHGSADHSALLLVIEQLAGITR